MFFIRAIYCRTFQTAFKIMMPILPYREPDLVSSTKELSSVLKLENIKSVLIVTDSGIVKMGLASGIEEVLKKNDIAYAIYDNVKPNPTVANVEEAVLMYHRNKCDGLIAIGGGSSIDCAKAVGARIAYPRKSIDKMKGILKILRPLATLIAIPTTAGTGSEATLASIITDPEKKHKYALMSFPLIPHYAMLDATLTYSLPPQLTATTGMDVLTHAVEAYIGRSTTAETRELALEATRLVFRNIYMAYVDGNNYEARKNMLIAANKAGIAFSKSYVGYIHALAHSLSGIYGTPHGLANAVIMPYVLESYGACIHKKLYELARSANICSKRDSYEEGAKKFIEAIKELNKKMMIPDKIEGICREDIPLMARYAEKEANPLYPVPILMTTNELEQFYYRIGDFT